MIVSLTIVRYRKLFIPFALMAMALHRLFMWRQPGCTFWKLLGSGKNGTFDLQPDWQQWGLMAAWKDQNAFENFYHRSAVNYWWELFGVEKWTVLLSPLQCHGKWDAQEPFSCQDDKEYSGPVAVLTRATIRLNKLKGFWSNVNEVASLMKNAKGFITSLGIGEAPLYRQATFSVWESLDDVKAFAYRSREHGDVIRKTRAENWYKEELFARFKPLAAFGTIKGQNPLQDHIKHTNNESNSRTSAPRL